MKSRLIIWLGMMVMLSSLVFARGSTPSSGGLPLLDIAVLCPDGYHFSDANSRCEPNNPVFSILDFNSSVNRPAIIIGLAGLGYYLYKKRKK